jgi:rubrerythrin
MIPKELTALEVLGIAIRSEIDAQNIYREMAERVSNPRAKERFHLLVAEEQQHQNLLERKHRELFPDVPLKLPPSQLPPKAATAELRNDLSLREALDLAIREERHARDFYLEAAVNVDDPTGKAMMKFMADMEYAHQMSLTAEYDMLVRYPHYYEDGAEPWREERGLVREKP